MYFVGIDIGSTASKIAIRGNKELEFVLPTGGIVKKLLSKYRRS
jgi:activator of 2-hydroxyglutaryl-CoA dehydratase